MTMKLTVMAQERSSGPRPGEGQASVFRPVTTPPRRLARASRASGSTRPKSRSMLFQKASSSMATLCIRQRLFDGKDVLESETVKLCQRGFANLHLAVKITHAPMLPAIQGPSRLAGRKVLRFLGVGPKRSADIVVCLIYPRPRRTPAGAYSFHGSRGGVPGPLSCALPFEDFRFKPGNGSARIRELQRLRELIFGHQALDGRATQAGERREFTRPDKLIQRFHLSNSQQRRWTAIGFCRSI